MKPPAWPGAALAWFGELVASERTDDLTLLLQAAVAAAVCADADPAAVPAARETLARARERYARALRAGMRCTHWTALLSACVVDRAAFGGMLPELEQWAGAAAQALAGVPGEQRAQAYLPAWLLLSRLDLLPPPPLPDDRVDARDWTGLLLDPAQLDEAVREVERRSLHGLRPVAAPPELRRVMEATLYCRMSDYRLDGACVLLRALAYLDGGATPATRAARRFVALQQDQDGAFGFLDEEIAAVAASAAGPHPGAGLRAGVSLECVWTLAEAGGYRLFRDLGGALGAEPARAETAQAPALDASGPVGALLTLSPA